MSGHGQPHSRPRLGPVSGHCWAGPGAQGPTVTGDPGPTAHSSPGVLPCHLLILAEQESGNPRPRGEGCQQSQKPPSRCSSV